MPSLVTQLKKYITHSSLTAHEEVVNVEYCCLMAAAVMRFFGKGVVGPDTRRKKTTGERHSQFPRMRLDIDLDVSDRAINLSIKDIPQHPSMTDEPGVLAIYEPLHALLHICVGKGPAHTRYESIQPLRL
jgi:hypothetical protein